MKTMHCYFNFLFKLGQYYLSPAAQPAPRVHSSRKNDVELTSFLKAELNSPQYSSNRCVVCSQQAYAKHPSFQNVVLVDPDPPAGCRP